MKAAQIQAAVDKAAAVKGHAVTLQPPLTRQVAAKEVGHLQGMPNVAIPASQVASAACLVH